MMEGNECHRRLVEQRNAQNIARRQSIRSQYRTQIHTGNRWQLDEQDMAVNKSREMTRVDLQYFKFCFRQDVLGNIYFDTTQ
jgi:hypothetical protein